MFARRVGLVMWKEFLQLRRDRLILPLVFVMPLLQLVMFGYVVGSDVRDLPTAVIDFDRTPASRQVVRAFEESGYFRTIARPSSEAEVRTLMDSNRAAVAVIVPRGFGREVAKGQTAPVNIIVDGSESKSAQVAQGYAAAVVADLSGRLQPPPSAVANAALPAIDARVRVLFNPGLRSINAMVPGLIAFILLLTTTMLMSQSVVKERERGTLEQMFVTPITKTEYLLGKVLPYCIIAGAQVVLIFAVGVLWFGVPFNGSVLIVGLGSLLFLLTCIGQGLIVSTLSRTRYQAQLATMFIVLPSFLLSGFVFPLESMPRAVYLVTYLIPLRYFLVVLRAEFMKGPGIGPLVPQLAAMAVFATVIFGVALLRFRKKLAD